MLDLLQFGPDGWGDELLAGTWLTIRLALATLPVGIALGFIIALARRSSKLWLSASGNAFATVFRGLPELLTLFIVYYGGQILLQKLVGLFSDTYVEINGFIAGLFALGLVFAAYASEVFLGAFRGIGSGQYEAANALGLRPFATMRLVIVPQLIRLALPGLANLWLVLLKDTALVSVIALEDLMRKTNLAAVTTKEPFLFYSVACLIYLGLSIVSSAGIFGIERWSERGLGRTK
jgi:polar amino acid transport system permease protein